MKKKSCGLILGGGYVFHMFSHLFTVLTHGPLRWSSRLTDRDVRFSDRIEEALGPGSSFPSFEAQRCAFSDVPTIGQVGWFERDQLWYRSSVFQCWGKVRYFYGWKTSPKTWGSSQMINDLRSDRTDAVLMSNYGMSSIWTSMINDDYILFKSLKSQKYCKSKSFLCRASVFVSLTFLSSRRLPLSVSPGPPEAWRWRKHSLQGELSFQRLLASPELLAALEELGKEMPLVAATKTPEHRSLR